MDKQATPPRELARLLIIHGKFGVVRAIRAATKGDTALLAQLFRSSRPLSPRERKLLACYVEGRFKRKRGAPRGDRLTDQRLKRMRAAKILRSAKQEIKKAGERYSHEEVMSLLVKKLADRGVRLTARDIELELKRPTRLRLKSRK